MQIADETMGNKTPLKAKFFLLRKPLERPERPRQAEYNGFEHAKPDKKPITQPQTGPRAEENTRVHNPERIKEKSIPNRDILPNAMTKQTAQP